MARSKDTGASGPGACQTDADSGPNQTCFIVNGIDTCFCKPEQACGRGRCANPNTSSCVA